MPLSKLGPFAEILGQQATGIPGHLELLSLAGRGSQLVIDQIRKTASAPEAQGWVAAMLGDPDWRPHLVASVVYLLDVDQRLDRHLLWAAMDAGSWAAPQLAVTACYTDLYFEGETRDRLAVSCPVALPTGLTAAERHNAIGPLGPDARRAKLIVSLLTASEEVPALRSWAATVREEPDVAPLLGSRRSDDAGRIVGQWRGAVRQGFLERGIELRPQCRHVTPRS